MNDLTSSYDIFNGAITQALRKYWGHPEYEDMYQECYMKILDVLHNNTYDPVYNLFGYAYTIARNTISSYMYHYSKDTTLAEDDLTAIWDIPAPIDISSEVHIKEALELTLSQFKNVLPKDFNEEKLLDLVYKEDPTDLPLLLAKGALIWTLASYHN